MAAFFNHLFLTPYPAPPGPLPHTRTARPRATPVCCRHHGAPGQDREHCGDCQGPAPVGPHVQAHHCGVGADVRHLLHHLLLLHFPLNLLLRCLRTTVYPCSVPCLVAAAAASILPGEGGRGLEGGEACLCVCVCCVCVCVCVCVFVDTATRCHSPLSSTHSLSLPACVCLCVLLGSPVPCTTRTPFSSITSCVHPPPHRPRGTSYPFLWLQPALRSCFHHSSSGVIE